MLKIFIDTAPLIYLFEGQESLCAPVRRQLDDWLVAGAELATSVITVMELLVHPIRRGDTALEYRYRAGLADLMTEPFFPVDETVAALAARYRALHGCRPADALQLAAAVIRRCDIFYTNDLRLPVIAGIQIVPVTRGKAEMKKAES